MEETKEKILTHASALFMKYGFKSITMDDICRELGMSKKTIYQFYSDKNELVSACIDAELSTMECGTDAIMSKHENPIDAMIAIIEFTGGMMQSLTPGVLFDLKKYFRSSWDKLDNHIKQSVFDSVKVNVESGQKKGLYRKDTDINHICTIYVHLVHLLIDPDLMDKGVVIRDLQLAIIRYHIRAISTLKGLEYFEEKSKHLPKNFISTKNSL